MTVYVVISRMSGYIAGVFANEKTAHAVCEHANWEAAMLSLPANCYRVSAEPVLQS